MGWLMDELVAICSARLPQEAWQVPAETIGVVSSCLTQGQGQDQKKKSRNKSGKSQAKVKKKSRNSRRKPRKSKEKIKESRAHPRGGGLSKRTTNNEVCTIMQEKKTKRET
mmetsp:Transcript_20567/g.30643  ORF Transcript_20567/g.30643 Transcript_20567/m.30643 type:complete len:111 (+) Transcript_20567:188-520(+)